MKLVWPQPARARLAWPALGLAALVLALDQASKAWILQLLAEPPHHLPVMPLLSFTLVWNRGVTFGLLQNHQDFMPYVLSAVAIIIAAVLLRWLWRVELRLTALAIGLVLGGAVGNIIDRFRFGAVVDFIHVDYYPWVFNVADSAVVVGVGLLIWDSFRHQQKPVPPTQGAG